MAGLLPWLGKGLHDFENGVGGFVNGAAHTVGDAVNNVEHAVGGAVNGVQQGVGGFVNNVAHTIAPPQVGMQRPGYNPSPSPRPQVPSFNPASLSHNSVINQTNPGFNPLKGIGDFANGVGGTIANLAKPTSDGGINVLADIGNGIANTGNLVVDMGKGAVGGVTGNQQLVNQANKNFQQHFDNSIPGAIYHPLDVLGTGLGAAIAGNQLLNKGYDPNIVTDAMNQQTQHVGLSTDNSQLSNSLKIGSAGAQTALNVATAGSPVFGKTAEALSAQTGKVLSGNALKEYLQQQAAKEGSSLIKEVGKQAVPNAAIGAASGAAGTVGQDNATPLDYLKNALTGATGGAVMGAANPFIGAGASKVGQLTKDSSVRSQNFGLKPPTNLNDAELAAARKVVDANSNPVNPVNLTTQDAKLYNQAQAKLGQKPGTPDGHQAVVQALNAHRNFDVQVAQRKLAVQNALQSSSQFAQKHLIPGSTLETKGGQSITVSPEDAQFIHEQVAGAPSADAYRQQLIDRLWQANKKGSGVDSTLVRNDPNSNDVTGRVTVSNNSPLYQAFYKEYGRAPTKTAISEMVDHELGLAKDGVHKNLLTQNEVSPFESDIYSQLKERDAAFNHLMQSEPTAKQPTTEPAQTQPQGQLGQNPVAAQAVSLEQKPVATEQPGGRISATAKEAQTQPRADQTTQQTTPQAQDIGQRQAKPLSSDNTTVTPDTQVNVKDYVNQQHAAQEQARKAGNLSGFSKIRHEVSTKLIDNLAPIENTLKKSIKDGAQVSQSNHITPQLDRALRADTIAGQYIKDNGLAKVIQNVPNTKEFDQYLIAKHASDLEKNGVNTGRNLAADKQLIDTLAPKYEQHAQAIKEYNNKLLDTAVNYGLVKKTVADGLKQKYPHYVPMNRIFGEGEKNTFVGQGGIASKSTQTVVQKIKGSNREIESPLASIAHKTVDVVTQGERNKAAQILASYRTLPGNPFSLRELKPSETVGAKPVIAYLDHGKVRRFETTPEIEAAAKSLNKQQMNILGKIASVPTRILRLGATGVNAGFALANVAKDVVSAAINTEHSIKASILNPRVAGKATAAAFNHGSKSYAELVREGAGGTSFDIGRDNPRHTVTAIRAQKNVKSKIAYTVTHPGQLMRVVEDTIGRSEEFNRAVQYYGNKQAALDKGMSDYESRIYGANAARHNTVNFARHGDWGQVLNTVVPYLNAGAQGSRTFLRNIKERPVQTLTKVAVLSTMPALTTTAWNLSDPKRKQAYDDISDFEKQGNIIIVPPNPVKDPKTGQWNVIKIPVSQEVANLNNIARSVFEAGKGDTKLDPAQVIGDLIGTTTSLNAGSPRQIANQVTPQALKPVIENLTNQNLFTGNKIVPDSQKNLPAPDQIGQGTSGTAQLLGKLTGTSPRMIDNTIKTAAGGAGQTGINALDNLLAATGVIPQNQVQGKSIMNSITGRFYGAAGKPTSDAINTQFNKLRDQVINSDTYKNATVQDRAKMLNRLQTDVSAVNYNAADTANPNSGYTPPKLTKNQVKLSTGNFNTSTYTTPTKTATQKTADLNASNDAEYKQLLATYNQKVKDGSYSQAQQIKAQTTLNKAKVGADYSKQTRDAYGLTKAQLNNLVSTDPNGKTVLNQVLAYGDALVNSGLATYNKFRNSSTGAVSLSSAKSSSGRKATSKSTGLTAGKSLVTLTKSMNHIRVPKTTGTKAPSFKVTPPKLTKTGLKTYKLAKTTRVRTSKKKTSFA